MKRPTHVHDESRGAMNMQGGQGQVVMVQTVPPAVAAVITAAAVIGAVFGIASYVRADELSTQFQRVERENRVLQQQVMDQSALLLREGISQPGDSTNGPAGNLQYRRKEK